jgi:hypothetical protein
LRYSPTWKFGVMSHVGTKLPCGIGRAMSADG